MKHRGVLVDFKNDHGQVRYRRGVSAGILKAYGQYVLWHSVEVQRLEQRNDTRGKGVDVKSVPPVPAQNRKLAGPRQRVCRYGGLHRSCLQNGNSSVAADDRRMIVDDGDGKGGGAVQGRDPVVLGNHNEAVTARDAVVECPIEPDAAVGTNGEHGVSNTVVKLRIRRPGLVLVRCRHGDQQGPHGDALVDCDGVRRGVEHGRVVVYVDHGYVNRSGG